MKLTGSQIFVEVLVEQHLLPAGYSVTILLNTFPFRKDTD